MVNKAIKIHSLKPKAAKFLGELLTCCAYMCGCLKSDKGAISITVKAKDGDGVVSVSGDKDLHIRGYVDGSCEESLVGGTLTVIKDDGFYRPFIGTCEVKTDNISEIIMQYYHQSEQIPTAVSVGVKLDDNGSCLAAGGVIMQLLPGTSDENMDKAENAMQDFVNAADVVEELGADGIITKFFKDDIESGGLYLLHPDYVCNCSRQKIASVIIPLGKVELYNIIQEQGQISVHCHYCNTDYTFDKEDVDQLFKQ
jgi:molecular chaperone Hsp33